VFRVTSPIQENFGVGRDSWEYGPPGGAALEKGIDVGRMKDEKLVALYVFVDWISKEIVDWISKENPTRPQRVLK
jgi:hypothetical protein